MTIASPDAEFATALAYDLSVGNFRAYTSPDIIGVEVGRAVKNVLAVATGFSDGFKVRRQTPRRPHHSGTCGDDTSRVALGAQRETFMGLAGWAISFSRVRTINHATAGLACCSPRTTHRKRRLRKSARLLKATLPPKRHARSRSVWTSTCRCGEAVYQVLYERLPVMEVVRGLMSRPIKAETE